MADDDCWAKSRRDDSTDPPTLCEHTRSVCQAADALLGASESPTRLARSILRFFGLGLDDFGLVRQHTLVGSALHDIGKANDGFQASVGHPAYKHGEGPREQVIRHEHLSAMWTAHELVANWLKDAVDLDLILSAALTHHLKAPREPSHGLPAFGGGVGLAQRCSAIPAGIASVLKIAGGYIGKDSPPDLRCFPLHWTPNDTRMKKPVEDRAYLYKRNWMRGTADGSERRHRMLLAVRSLLIIADAAGSALVREGCENVADWIRKHALQCQPLAGAEITEKVIQPRIAELERKGKWDCSRGEDGWSGFQVASGTLGRRALLLAACGAGKTLAAWRWIAATLDHEAQAGRKYGRVLFLYPTRGTATEGFRDYVSWAPEADAALVHGTAAYDLAGLFSNPAEPDDRAGKRFVREEDARLFAMAQWPKRIFSATVDAFLGAMANQYGPLCLLPVLADSVVVIDEVHSFSESMFAALRCLLKRFDLPVLCMTASLPNHRREAMSELGLEVFPREPKQFEDLSRASDHPRYRVYATDRDSAERIVLEKLKEGKRVLWVVNRVDECQRRYRRMVGTDGSARLAPADAPVLCYHSRFRLCDRRDRHNAVVEEFQRKPRRRALVIATQVCEMSLDLDADVLVSEVAPVPSLIQRMGRCCREGLEALLKSGRFGEVYLYEPEKAAPYEKADTEQGLAFRKALAEKTAANSEKGGAVSQSDLSDQLEAIEQDIEPDRHAAFWDSGFWAVPTEFREGNELSVDCVLDSQVKAYQSAPREQRPAFIVPVPRKVLALLRTESSILPLMVAPAELYDEQTGFRTPEATDGLDK